MARVATIRDNLRPTGSYMELLTVRHAGGHGNERVNSLSYWVNCGQQGTV